MRSSTRAEDERAEEQREHRGDASGRRRRRGAAGGPTRARRGRRRSAARSGCPSAARRGAVVAAAPSRAASRSTRGSASGRTTAGAPPSGCARRRGRARSRRRRGARGRRPARRRAPRAGSPARPSSAPPGTKTSESTMRIAIMTTNVTACVATIENATSWRGNRTFLISSALSIIERAADCSETEKKSQQARPGEQVDRVVRDVRRSGRAARRRQVDAEQDERIQQRPEDAEHRALVLRVEIAPEEVREELAVAQQVGVDHHRPEVV